MVSTCRWCRRATNPVLLPLHGWWLFGQLLRLPVERDPAADAYAYMQTQGGLTRDNGMKFRKSILSVGNTKPLMETYVEFRGQEPTTDGLLIRRGLKKPG